MVVFSCLLSVSYTACNLYSITGHNGHLEHTCLSGKQVHNCRRTDDPSWIGDIVLGERINQQDWGHSPRRMYAPTVSGTQSLENVCTNRIGDIFLVEHMPQQGSGT